LTIRTHELTSSILSPWCLVPARARVVVPFCDICARRNATEDPHGEPRTRD
jgi:hypothetical protein